MVKLYKLDASPPARACMMACELFNVPVELIDVNLLEGKHNTPEFLKKNPLHTIPVLEDGSLVIHDRCRRDIYAYSRAMVKLYKLDASPPARACMMACELFNVPVELIDVNLLEGKHNTPEFLKKNPLHTIPVLEDGSLVIHDSHAAIMYLADVYGKQEQFYPKDPKQRVLVNQKLFFNSTILFPRLRNITYPLIIEGNKDIPQNKFDAIEEAYGFLEEFLSRNRFLAGNHITIADIAAYATVSSLVFILELNAQKYPKTTAWLKDLEKLPYVQKGNAKGAAELKNIFDSKLA